MRFYRTLHEQADVKDLQDKINKLEKLLPVLDDAGKENLKKRIAQLRTKLPSELKYGKLSDFKASDSETPDVKKSARLLARRMHEGYEDGWIFSDWKKVADTLDEISSKEEYEEVNVAFTEFNEDGLELKDVLQKLARKNWKFELRYYPFLQKHEIDHTLSGDPRRLQGTVGGKEWNAVFGGGKYAFDKDSRKYKYVGKGGNLKNSAGLFQSPDDAMNDSIIYVEGEETYHGNAFWETYGDMWFNEDEILDEAEYQGRKVKLGKPMQGDVKKFKVYVKDPKTGNVKKVNFGDPDMKIKKSNPARRKSFRARHNCDNPGPRTKARYWSCRKW